MTPRPTLYAVGGYEAKAQQRLADRMAAAIAVADHLAEHVMKVSADPLSFALAANLRDLIALCREKAV